MALLKGAQETLEVLLQYYHIGSKNQKSKLFNEVLIDPHTKIDIYDVLQM